MVRLIALIAFAASAALAAPAYAATFYKVDTTKDSAFVMLDRASVTSTGANKTAKLYLVRASQTVEIQDDEFDCVGAKMRTTGRSLARSDLSPLRRVAFEPEWRNLNAGSSGERVAKFVCAFPQAAGSAPAFDADSLAGALRAGADVLRANRKDGAPTFLRDKTTIGDCVFTALPPAFQQAALANVIHNEGMEGLPRDRKFRDAVLAQKTCAHGSTDKDALVGAAVATFTRYGVIAKLRLAGAVNEDDFAAIWNTADPALRAPFDRVAQFIVARGPPPDVRNRAATAAAVTELSRAPAVAAVLAAQAKLTAKERARLMFEYFAATSIGELAEAKLAPAS